MPTLTLFRHAKAAQPLAQQDDFKRPLTDRGKRDAAAMGNILAGLDIDLALVSTALRTRETWALAAQQISQHSPAMPVRVSFEDGLYHCRASDLLKRLRDIADSPHNVLVVGHNPTLHEAALQLSRNDTGLACREIRLKFPTAAVAIFRVETASWEKLGPDCVKLERFVTPTPAS